MANPSQDPGGKAAPLAVRHCPAARRFQVDTGGGRAVLAYELREQTVAFTHTEVPEPLRGRGIAEALVRAGFAWAERQGLRVEPRCSYVARFIGRNREFQSLLKLR